jgi:hypothetical protein
MIISVSQPVVIDPGIGKSDVIMGFSLAQGATANDSAGMAWTVTSVACPM